jgi:hypothetical protein
VLRAPEGFGIEDLGFLGLFGFLWFIIHQEKKKVSIQFTGLYIYEFFFIGQH